MFSRFSRSALSISRLCRFLIDEALLSSSSSSEPTPTSLDVCMRNFLRLDVIRSVWVIVSAQIRWHGQDPGAGGGGE